MKAGMVSGPITQLANIMGNGVFLVVRSPIDAVAAVIGAMHNGAERVTAMEAPARVVGAIVAIICGNSASLPTNSSRADIPC